LFIGGNENLILLTKRKEKTKGEISVNWDLWHLLLNRTRGLIIILQTIIPFFLYYSHQQNLNKIFLWYSLIEHFNDNNKRTNEKRHKIVKQ